jgi:hypothetical protein
MCRGHTLGRVFVNLLLEVAEDEISFRTVVRDLKTKRPILQLVLLSSKAWLSSGCCVENDMDGSHGTADLQPSVKLLYSDNSNAPEADLRYAECLLVMMLLSTYLIMHKPFKHLVFLFSEECTAHITP